MHPELVEYLLSGRQEVTQGDKVNVFVQAAGNGDHLTWPDAAVVIGLFAVLGLITWLGLRK